MDTTQRTVAHRLLIASIVVLVPIGVAHATLGPRSFLELAEQPINWRPSETSMIPMPFAVADVVSRPDGLVFVAGWERDKVYVVDARDPDVPVLVTEILMPNESDTCGLALDETLNRLWIGGDNAWNPAIGDNGLYWADLPPDPFDPLATWTPTRVMGVESGVTPNIFVGTDGRRYILTVARPCQHPSTMMPLPPRIVDITDPGSPVVVPSGTFSFSNPRTRIGDASVYTTSSGQILAAVAATFGGVFVYDLTSFPASPPVLLAHFDWTYTAPDFDGDPATMDFCDRNGDGDFLECGEPGRDPDGLLYNSASVAAFTEVDGQLLLVTADTKLAGHVRVWAWSDIVSTCPGEMTCPDDVDCLPSIPNCPPIAAPAPCPPNAWPVVDVVRPLAYYQVDKCPLGVNDLIARGAVLLIAYAEDGVHYIDLASQGLPSTAVGSTAFEMVASDWFDTLPNDSDTILENCPGHVPGMNDGCQSANADWPAGSCSSSTDPAGNFRVVMNQGLRSASAVDWSGCRVYVSDQGTPDSDELPHPSHVGQAQGVWVFDFAADIGPSLRVTRAAANPTSITLDWGGLPMTPQYQVHRGTLDALRISGYDHACIDRTPLIPYEAPDQISDGITVRPDFYYLIASECSIEGSLGRNSRGDERPGSPTPCP